MIPYRYQNKENLQRIYARYISQYVHPHKNDKANNKEFSLLNILSPLCFCTSRDWITLFLLIPGKLCK